MVKPFIRDRKVVHPEQDTCRLCENAGFVFVEQHHRRLTSMSFWRTIYAKRYPTAPTIDFEYILVFGKRVFKKRIEAVNLPLTRES